MRLYLVQHGAAVPKAENPQRPLTAQGMAEVERLAQQLGAAGVRVGRVVHSGRQRAAQTAAILAAAIAPQVAIETSDLLVPEAEPAVLDWQMGAWDTDTLLVGHMPALGRLASHLLCPAGSALPLAFTPASAACLQREQGQRWTLLWLLPPALPA